jgi:hypothetical protein
MTPKEEAIKMFYKFRTLASDETIEKRERTAFECSKITIKYLIDCSVSYDKYNATWATQVGYWEDVLGEIIKLYKQN